MKIDEAQKETVRKWINDGLKLSEIQSRLASELGVSMTYMETRFLMDDLKLQPKDPVVEVPVEIKAPAPKSPTASEELPSEPDELTPPTEGSVRLSVDQIARPGSLISGKVTFSDGKGAQWHLDEMGRLGVAPDEKGYKPSQGDILAFQNELQNVIAKMGF